MNAHERPETHVVESLLAARGRTYCAELGINLESNAPDALFRLLSAAILIENGMRCDIALAAADEIADHGWTSPERLATCRRADLHRVLGTAGYVRNGSAVADLLKSATGTLLQTYLGDLRSLRDRAGYDPARECEALLSLPGMGANGLDFFIREVQAVWDEHYPFACRPSLAAAARLKLPVTPEGLAQLTSRAAYPRLVAALARSEMAYRATTERHYLPALAWPSAGAFRDPAEGTIRRSG